MAASDDTMPKPRYVTQSTPIGTVEVTLQGDQVVEVDILPEPRPAGGPRDPLAQQVRVALRGYFERGYWPEGLPLAPVGTDFQRRVWDCLRAIRPGRTRTYGDIAAQLHTSPRAVGNACRANPIPLLIPCHRVVAAGGLGGFAGQTTGRLPAIKRALLQHEQTVA